MENSDAKNIKKEEDVRRTKRTNGLGTDAKKLAKSEFAKKKVQIVFY